MRRKHKIDRGLRPSLIFTTLILQGPVGGQEIFRSSPDQVSPGPLSSDSEIEELPELEVTASIDSDDGVLFGDPIAPNARLPFAGASTTVISGEELVRKLQPTLGATLASEPGISASSFSPAVSRPIVRGFDGVRVRTLQDGLGTMDLSAESADHGMLIDPLMMEEVELYRGPVSLLYGNSAIGGAINTRTRVIPSVDRGGEFEGGVLAGFDTQGTASQVGLASEFRTGNLAFGLSASGRWADDIRIPDKPWTDDYENLVQPRVFVPGVGSVAVENPSGTLENSFHRANNLSFGARWGSEEETSIGFAYQYRGLEYGLPYFYPGDETDFFGTYKIDATLGRWDFDLSHVLDPDGLRKELRFRFGIGDYKHDEVAQGDGKDRGEEFIETAFEKETYEGRLEFLIGEETDVWNGIIGAQFNHDDLASTRLVIPPPTEFFEENLLKSRGGGLFGITNWSCGPWTLQAGARVDYRDTSISDQFGGGLGEDDFSNSQSLSLTYDGNPVGPFHSWQSTLSLSRIERQPTVIERYAFYHSAPYARFIIGGDFDGDPLDIEESTGIELSLSGDWDRGSATTNFFFYHFDNFTFLEDQFGISFEPTAQFVQTTADFIGVETSILQNLVEEPGSFGDLNLRVVADVMRGINRDRDDTPLPRIPAARLGCELTWQKDDWTAALDMRYVFAQNRTAEIPVKELPTDDYLMVNASVGWQPRDDLFLSLRLNNLLNQDARDHTSFRKDTTPLPGFGVSTEARWFF